MENNISENLPLFSVSQYTTYPLTFEQDVVLYQKLEIQGIEVCEEKLSSDPVKAREQLAMLKESGLLVTSVQPKVLSLFPHNMDTDASPQKPQERLARYRQTIDLFSVCFPGQYVTLVTGGGKAPGFNFRLAHQTARKLYPELADYAADHGMRIMFEPLSPVLMNAFTFISTFEEALQLIDDVDRENFGLALDVWHVWREYAIAKRISQLRKRIFGVHICDWPAGEPRDVMDRVLPGEGIIDLPAFLGAIDRAGFEGGYCLEIFSGEHLPDSLWKQDFEKIVERGRKGFLKAWHSRH
jgi:sugar phosphate isomerase/epimerase